MIIQFSFVILGEAGGNGELVIRDAITSGNVNPNMALSLLHRIIVMGAEKRATEKAALPEKEKVAEVKPGEADDG